MEYLHIGIWIYIIYNRKIMGLIVRVMFGNFSKIGQAAGARPIWQISKHHEYY
jgi:hypothetical protein